MRSWSDGRRPAAGPAQLPQGEWHRGRRPADQRGPGARRGPPPAGGPAGCAGRGGRGGRSGRAGVAGVPAQCLLAHRSRRRGDHLGQEPRDRAGRQDRAADDRRRGAGGRLGPGARGPGRSRRRLRRPGGRRQRRRQQQLDAAAAGRGGGAPAAGVGGRPPLRRRGERLHGRARHRGAPADRPAAPLRRAGGGGRPAAGAEGGQAQGPAPVPAGRHAADRRGHAAGGHRPARLRARRAAPRHAVRRDREVARVRRPCAALRCPGGRGRPRRAAGPPDRGPRQPDRAAGRHRGGGGIHLGGDAGARGAHGGVAGGAGSRRELGQPAPPVRAALPPARHDGAPRRRCRGGPVPRQPRPGRRLRGAVPGSRGARAGQLHRRGRGRPLPDLGADPGPRRSPAAGRGGDRHPGERRRGPHDPRRRRLRPAPDVGLRRRGRAARQDDGAAGAGRLDAGGRPAARLLPACRPSSPARRPRRGRPPDRLDPPPGQSVALRLPPRLLASRG